MQKSNLFKTFLGLFLIVGMLAGSVVWAQDDEGTDQESSVSTESESTTEVPPVEDDSDEEVSSDTSWDE